MKYPWRSHDPWLSINDKSSSTWKWRKKELWECLTTVIHPLSFQWLIIKAWSLDVCCGCPKLLQNNNQPYGEKNDQQCNTLPLYQVPQTKAQQQTNCSSGESVCSAFRDEDLNWCRERSAKMEKEKVSMATSNFWQERMKHAFWDFDRIEIGKPSRDGQIKTEKETQRWSSDGLDFRKSGAWLKRNKALQLGTEQRHRRLKHELSLLWN